MSSYPELVTDPCSHGLRLGATSSYRNCSFQTSWTEGGGRFECRTGRPEVGGADVLRSSTGPGQHLWLGLAGPGMEEALNVNTKTICVRVLSRTYVLPRQLHHVLRAISL